MLPEFGAVMMPPVLLPANYQRPWRARLRWLGECSFQNCVRQHCYPTSLLDDAERLKGRSDVARPAWPVATHKGKLTARRLVITFVPTVRVVTPRISAPSEIPIRRLVLGMTTSPFISVAALLIRD
jgi:hypothetical protein